MPTEMYCLSVRIRASCLKRPRSDPLPNGLLMEAWKAIVGYSSESALSHFFVTQEGTCGFGTRRRGVGKVHFEVSVVRSIAEDTEAATAQTNEIPLTMFLFIDRMIIRWYGQLR